MLLVLALGTGACALHRSDPAAGPSRTAISEAEIDSVHAVNADEVIRKLRPQFLRSRGRMSLDSRQPPALPNVYVDNMYYGDATVLRDIAAATIGSITFYNAAEAQYTFGRGNTAGVISIITKH